jgi:hypothetical protein
MIKNNWWRSFINLYTYTHTRSRIAGIKRVGVWHNGFGHDNNFDDGTWRESNFRLFSSAHSFIIARLLFYHFSAPRPRAIFMPGQEGKILSDRDELRLADDDNSPLSTMKINDSTPLFYMRLYSIPCTDTSCICVFVCGRNASRDTFVKEELCFPD